MLILYQKLQEFLWGPVMLAAFFAISLSYTIQTHFFQFSHLKLWLHVTLGSMLHSAPKKNTAQSVSPFQAMSAALAGSMGIGNIAGVATALVAGGPGAIFWMWISALFGMMTKYAEIILGMFYRYKDVDGNWFGGPMVYLKNGLHSNLLSAFFCICCILASFGMGNMTQGNSMANVLEHSLGIPPLMTGMCVAVLTALVIMGGMKRIAKISGILIPFMSILYLLCAALIILINYKAIPHVICLIFTEAFKPRSAVSGAVGYHMLTSLRLGVSRGVFSNEAGLGSSVMAHTASSAEEPAQQGMWGIFEVFADTIVVCTLTAFAILTSGVYNLSYYEAALKQNIELANGSVLASKAFSSALGSFGESFIAFSTVIFAFATLIAWSHYGSQCVLYLFQKRAVFYYKLLFLAVIIIGCITGMEFVWNLSDMFNALMAIPNLIALTLLSPIVIRETNQYLLRQDRKSVV